MFKIAILGCENSHANSFLDYIKSFDDIEVVGVYSNEIEAAKKLNEKYGVAIYDNYDAFVGKVDGIIITARDGKYHFEYAKPYLKSNIPMFIDKPITIDPKEAKKFKEALIKNKIRVTGGSSCIHIKEVQALKKIAKKEEILGGLFRAPMDFESKYGGFYFYSQHLTQIIMEICGNYPLSIKAIKNNDVIDVTFNYEKYSINGLFINHVYKYDGLLINKEKAIFMHLNMQNYCFEKEFDEFYNLLKGKKQRQSYDDFFAPVYVMNAIVKSLNSNKEEKVKY